MTLNELTYQVIEAVRPELHDDDVLDLRYIKDLIHNQRALWIRNELNKDRDIPEEIIQDLGCVEIEAASTTECCDFSSECKVMRTVLKIPKPITLHHREAIERIGPTDFTKKSYSIKDYKEVVFFGNGKFNRNMIAAYYRNDRIYLYSKDATVDLLEHINIRLVASDPTEAAKFNHCTGDPCYTDDSEYPLSDYMWNYMKEMIIKQVLLKYQLSNDTTNDANNTISGEK
jgi:hypothetical protein